MLLVVIFYHTTPNNNNQQNKMFSSRNKSASASTSSTTMKKKQDVVFSEDCQKHQQQTRNTGKNKKEMYIGIVSDQKQLENVMKSQKQKDKQHLNAWKRTRNTKKRTENILLLQSRRVKELEKMASVKVFDEYEEHEGRGIYKHYCNRLNSNECEECFYGSTPIYTI